MRESNGNVTRVRKRVNLGDYNWTYSSEYLIFYTSASDAKGNPNSCVCAKYTDHGTITAFLQLSDKEISVSSGLSGNPLIVIKDTAYNDATTFKTAMSGVYLEYELATPTTETSSPFADPMSLNGCTTEEYVDTRSIPVPVGHETQYMGQSEDVVEIPSMPLADGDSVLHCQKSGNEAQIYWEGISGNKIGNEINLKNYSSSNPYITLSDGYVIVYSGTGTSGRIDVGFRTSDNGNMGGINMIVSATNQMQTTFIRKGMKVYFTQDTTGGSTIVVFRELV